VLLLEGGELEEAGGRKDGVDVLAVGVDDPLDVIDARCDSIGKLVAPARAREGLEAACIGWDEAALHDAERTHNCSIDVFIPLQRSPARIEMSQERLMEPANARNS